MKKLQMTSLWVLVSLFCFSQNTQSTHTNNSTNNSLAESLKPHRYATKAYSTAENSSKALNAIYFSEDFESAAMPTGWTEQLGASSNGWTFNSDASSAYWTIPSHTNYAAINDDDCNCDMSDVWLITPVIDLSAVPNPVLKFSTWMNNDTYTIKGSTDGGVNWSDIEVLTANSGWEDIIVDISAVANQANVKLAFHYSDNNTWGYGWALDDVSIEGAATTPDLRANTAGFVAEYYAVPFEQATFIPEGNVENIGTELTDAADMTLSITGGYSNSQNITTPLVNNASEDLIFSSFTAVNEGLHTFEYTINYANDADASNNTVSKDINITNELKRDNGIGIGNFGAGGLNGEIGQLFTINVADTLTSIRWDMAGTIGEEIAAVVREFTTEPGTELGRTYTVINDGSETYEANMLGIIVLQPGTYFIGLVEDENTCGIEATSTPFVDGTAWAFFNNVWEDLGSLGYEHTYNISAIFDNVIPSHNDVAIESINTEPVAVQGTINITGSVRNVATLSHLNSFDVTYTIDGGTASSVFPVTGLDLAQGTAYDFTHNVPWTNTPGQHTIEVTISNPNASTDENPSNNILSKEIIIVNELFPQTVVYEMNTGTWCGWCVRGHVGLNTMKHNITDGSWVGIAVHNGDPMVLTEYDTTMNAISNAYPNGHFNRTYFEIDPNVDSLETYYALQASHIPVAKVEAEGESFNTQTREMMFTLNTTFASDLNGSNYNIAAILIEDGVTGTDSDWDQNNYYSGGGSGPMTDWDGTDYTVLSDPIPAADMVYNHVARALIGGYNGVTNIFPVSAIYNTEYSHTFTHTLPADQDFDNISVIGLIIDNTTGKIINASSEITGNMSFYIVTDVEDIQSSDIKVYPNPTTDGLIHLMGIQNAKVLVYNTIGDIVLNESNVNSTVDLSALSSGNYLIKIIESDKVTSQKIILNK